MHDEAMRGWDEKALAALAPMLNEELNKKKSARMPHVIVPDAPLSLSISDKEGNQVYRIIVYKAQSEDVIKALRKKGYVTKNFVYNKAHWEQENTDRSRLKLEVENATTQLCKVAVGAFQQLFVALMHLKVVRAYIDGVLRFGIPPKFYIGIIFPKKNHEK